MMTIHPEDTRYSQIKHLLEKQVTKLLDFSENEFVSQIPPLPPAPPANHGKVLRFPVLIEPRLTLKQCLNISTIQNGLQTRPATDLLEKKECRIFSKHPYWLWCGFLTNRNQARILTTPFPGYRWVTASEGVFFLMHLWEDIHLEQREFTCPASMFKDNQKVDQFLTLEMTKKTFMESLGFEINLRTNEPDQSPIAKMRLTYTKRDLLGFENTPLFCAWPPDFDWKTAPEVEEPKYWKKLIP